MFLITDDATTDARQLCDNIFISRDSKRGYSGKHRDNRVLCKENIVSAIFMFAPPIINNVVHYI